MADEQARYCFKCRERASERCESHRSRVSEPMGLALTQADETMIEAALESGRPLPHLLAVKLLASRDDEADERRKLAETRTPEEQWEAAARVAMNDEIGDRSPAQCFEFVIHRFREDFEGDPGSDDPDEDEKPKREEFLTDEEEARLDVGKILDALVSARFLLARFVANHGNLGMVRAIAGEGRSLLREVRAANIVKLASPGPSLLAAAVGEDEEVQRERRRLHGRFARSPYGPVVGRLVNRVSRDHAGVICAYYLGEDGGWDRADNLVVVPDP